MKGQVKIERMFAYIVLDDDGSEGIPAIFSPMGPLPMVGADEERMKSLRPYAEDFALKHKKPVTFVCFENRRAIEVLQPAALGKPS